MKISLITLTLLCPTLIWGQQNPAPKPAPAVSAPAEGNAPAKQSFALRRGAVMQGIDLDTLLDEYSELVGRTLITAMNLPKVTFDFSAKNDFTHKEAKNFYESLLSSRGIAVLPMGDKFIIVIPAAEVAKTPPPFTQKKAADLPVSDVLVMVKVKLQHVMPSELVQGLSSLAKSPGAIMGIDHARMLYLRDSALNVKRMLEIIEDTDVIKETHEAVIPVGNASVKEIANHLNQLVSGTPNTAPTSSTSGRTIRSTSSRINTTRNRGLFILSGSSIIACESANSILVVAPTEAKLELAKSLIEKLKSNSKK